MQRVLVTGGGGYIGAVLVPKLLRNGYNVRVVDRFFFGRHVLEEASNLEVLVEDVRRLQPDFFRNIDYVIDLVAISNDPAAEMFSQATWEINFESRVRTAGLAKAADAKRYILPSSASIYGYHTEIVDESSPTNPLTVYAKANEEAEKGTLALGDDRFAVVVIRQATVFGYSPRMRFDLAVNGMTYGGWTNRKIPLMRDGQQYRPMVHIEDTTDLMIQLLIADERKIAGQIFNVGSAAYNFQIGLLGETIAKTVSEALKEKVDIEWYGDPDKRSYRLSFEKIEQVLGWKAKWTLEQGVSGIIAAIKNEHLNRTEETITLEWYRQMTRWHKIIHEVEMHGGILDID